MIPLIGPDEIKKKDTIKVNILLMGLDEIEKNIATKRTQHKKQTIEKIKKPTDQHKNQTIEKIKKPIDKISVHRASKTNNNWLTFRTTLAPNIRLIERLYYDSTGNFTMSSGFIGDKRRIILPVIQIE